MVAVRIIPCLDVRDGLVVKGVRFRDHTVVGNIVELALRYRNAGADELVFYDISASPQRRHVDPLWVEKVARELDIPFCVAGGIRDVATARQILAAGADKISVNSPALERPHLITELADAFGSQCVVVGVDSIIENGHYRVRQYTGDPEQMTDARRGTLDWIAQAERLGAGEIVLNCMDADGMRDGYDLTQLQAARSATSLPLIASGGAGSARHFLQVFQQTEVDGALAASVFHTARIDIVDLKQWLAAHGVVVRHSSAPVDDTRHEANPVQPFPQHRPNGHE